MIDESTIWIYRAQVQRIVDGDTVKMLIDLGMYVHSAHSIRVEGVDAPELFRGSEVERDIGRASRDFVVQWFHDHDHHGTPWPFYVRTKKDRQSFNRYVGSIECAQGHSLAKALIESGNAKASS